MENSIPYYIQLFYLNLLRSRHYDRRAFEIPDVHKAASTQYDNINQPLLDK
ncbi:hypothetical protein C8N25_12256 [Algoriphagus antarcticus]|uniref:Uncharacterized protein n=1 Tax=Algoriphagus antarcticus TaxID=238540 RepID=A0A3E0DLA3_9BACT|nr:hypothetical protein C8N25_12256 [Algoriphagus antarcticus]